MHNLVILSLIAATLVLGACRRETPYEPLKLGMTTNAAAHTAR